MAATNKANMDTMMERMNVLVARGGGARWMTQQDNENLPPGGNMPPPPGTDPTKKPRKQKALYSNCKMFVLPKPQNCYQLEAKKDKHWPGWKSVHAIA
jgi:hypothetical protein